MYDLLKIAKGAHDAGYNIVPANHKRPTEGYRDLKYNPIFDSNRLWGKTSVAIKLDGVSIEGEPLSTPLFVIDVDNHKAGNIGDASYERLVKDCGIDFEAESGCVVSSPRGGRHIYFYNPRAAKVNKKIPAYDEIDFLTAPFLCTLPHSQAKGVRYTIKSEKFDLTDLKPVPEKLLELIEKPTAIISTLDAPVLASSADEKRFKHVLQEHEGLQEGFRNEGLYKLACQGRDYGCGVPFLTDTLKQWDGYPPFSDDGEVERIVNSAFNSGQNTQGCKSLKTLYPKVANSTWGDLLERNKQGFLSAKFIRHNTYIYLKHSPQFAGKIRFNTFAQVEEWTEIPSWRNKQGYQDLVTRDFKQDTFEDGDLTELLGAKRVIDADYLFIEGLLYQTEDKLVPQTKTIRETITRIASENPFHPVLEHCSQLPAWDGISRIDDFFYTYCGSPRSQYNTEVARKTFAAIITRLFRPGTKYDYLLVLVGGQGKRKSSLAEALAIRKDWYSSNLGDIKSKDVIQNMLGKVITEIPELQAFKGIDIETVKAFLSNSVDRARLAYMHNAQDYPRSGIFIATHNKDDFLSDATGNRRFLPVKISDDSINIEAVKTDLPQLYAEAIQLYKKGEKLYLSQNLEHEADTIREDFLEKDDWDEMVLDWIEAPDRKPFSTKDVWEECLKREITFMGRKDSNRIANLLRRLGYESTNNHRIVVDGKRKQAKRWVKAKKS